MFCLCEEEFLITPSPVDALTPFYPLKMAVVSRIVFYASAVPVFDDKVKALKPLWFKAFSLVRPMRFERTTFRVGVFLKSFNSFS